MKYVEPRQVNEIADCLFYHKLDLPVSGEVGVAWDLRSCVDDYLGQCQFDGKRVLDVGTASGYLTFEMEKRGADVVSFDTPSAKNWNIVPHFQTEPLRKKADEVRRQSFQQVQNAYWHAHGQLKSQAKVFYGDIYDLPEELGNFDVVVLGMLVSHVRDPFQAIYSSARLSRDLVVITNQVPKSEVKKSFGRTKEVELHPSFMASATDVVTDAWWFLPPSCIERMLGSIGFEVIRQVECYPECLTEGRIGSERCVSIVGKRVAGTPMGVEFSGDKQDSKAA